MKFGLALRVMGPASQPGVLLECARSAEAAGIDDLWLQDHIAIPPDQAEGSDGRYLDPLAALAWLAASSEKIGLGTAVLVAPYRSPLPSLKSLATSQELSGGRILLGVGAGWMGAEFRALGLDRGRRGNATDRFLDLFHRCFGAEDDVVEENGQPFLFRPRPPAPPLFIGGAAPHALERAARHGGGWMPMSANPEQLAPEIATLHELAAARGHPTPEVAVLGGPPGDDPGRNAEHVRECAAIGVTRFIAGARYTSHDEFCRLLEPVAALAEATRAESRAESEVATP
jgi:probable F420-dependent oxidoreductase